MCRRGHSGQEHYVTVQTGGVGGVEGSAGGVIWRSLITLPSLVHATYFHARLEKSRLHGVMGEQFTAWHPRAPHAQAVSLKWHMHAHGTAAYR